MKHIFIVLKQALCIIAILVIQLQMVLSSDPASTTKISQEVKQKTLADYDVGLTIADSIHQEIKSNREVFQKMQCKNCRQDDKSKTSNFGKLIKGAETIATYMNYVSIVTTVGKKALSFLTGKGTNEEDPLDKLNDKLDDISREINNLRDELKASIEFNTWLEHEADYEAKIRAGEECLDEKLNVMNNVDDEKQKMKFALEFINCFESYQIEASAQEIYRLTGKPPSPTSQNLFELFIKEKGCDVLELSRLMMMMRDLMTSAAKQSMVYYFFKDGNENRVGKSMTKYQQYLYDIREYYDTQVWHCFRDSIENAKSMVTKTIDENNSNPGSLSSIIHEKLDNLIPWYSWTVAQFEPNKAPSVTLHPFLGGHSVTFNAEGEQFFMIEDYSSTKTNVIVVWQDSQDAFRSCDEIDISNTKVYFNPCEDCSSGSFVNSDNMMEEHTCNNHLRDIIIKKAHDGHFNPDRYMNYLAKHPVSFTISDKGNHNDACINDPCLNGGMCNYINYTNSRFCICKPFYEGVDCEIDVGTSLADNVTAVLAQLREHFGIMTGIPDVIDIYFQINDLAADVKNLQKSLQDYSEYGNIITLYGKSIKEAEYISNYHTDFQNEKIKIQNFGRTIDKFDFDYILLDFSQMITGDAIMVEDDFLTSKKKTFSQKYGSCTENYSNSVKSLMRNLVTLDQVVVESMLWHARWELDNTQSISKKTSILSDVHQAYEYTIDRQMLYYDNWNLKSCPSLNIRNGKISDTQKTELIYCDKGVSYEGLSFTMQCMDYGLKTDNHHNVTCIKNENGTLQWTGIPECELKEIWGNWTDWTECSVTCDTGIQYRYQRSNIGNIKKQNQTCDTGVKCCTESNGAHVCATGVCIWPDKLCDGNDDCGNNEDEDTCRYLRVGDSVALISPSCGGWLDCNKGEKGHDCYGETNCGGQMDLSPNDWEDCKAHVFDYIAAEGRLKDQAIRHGDRVALRFIGGTGYWLTCQWDDHCETHNCPGEQFEDNEYSGCTGEVYWILSYERRGDCDFKTSPGCIGEPIQPKDTIRLLHDAGGTGRWVSGDRHKTRLRPCDVRNNPDGCSCERWTINIKRYS